MAAFVARSLLAAAVVLRGSLFLFGCLRFPAVFRQVFMKMMMMQGFDIQSFAYVYTHALTLTQPPKCIVERRETEFFTRPRAKVRRQICCWAKKTQYIFCGALWFLGLFLTRNLHTRTPLTHRRIFTHWRPSTDWLYILKTNSREKTGTGQQTRYTNGTKWNDSSSSVCKSCLSAPGVLFSSFFRWFFARLGAAKTLIRRPQSHAANRQLGPAQAAHTFHY